MNFARLDGDPVDGHRAADLAPRAAAATAGIVALWDVVLVNAGNEAGVRPTAAAILWGERISFIIWFFKQLYIYMQVFLGRKSVGMF